MSDLLHGGLGYESLSIRDLLEARDLYHNMLLGKPNVVGTAVGLYLIRDEDHAGGSANRVYGAPRTFSNARVQPYSEPCIIVLVHTWRAPDAFGDGDGRDRLDGVIPSRIEMPDGRVVNICVVAVDPVQTPVSPAVRRNWPGGIAGGGFPLELVVQGETKVASVGCLVTDGHKTYALTNRHVCGDVGEPVFTAMRGKRTVAGRASAKQLTRLPFQTVYPDYPGERCYAALDVGLVELEDIRDWTSQVYGVGEPGELADLSERSFSLRLIGAPVLAHGAASGPLTGSIAGLFYRYKSVGGFDWLADFLIAPETVDGPQTRPGDSGTVWFLPAEAGGRPRPLAVEWGGQSLLMGGGRATANFALATALSTVCNLLDVDVKGDHNSGLELYWGSEGHYTIAARACGYVADPALKAFVQAHADMIAFDVASKSPDEIAGALKRAKDNEFIPLADVPDIVWKQSPRQVKGGRDTQVNSQTHRATGPEHPVHYADIDQTRPSDGKTLRELSLADPAHNLTVDFWRAFYTASGSTGSSSRGLLPFRCWQFYDAMVEAVRARDAPAFLCAAGILSHYVGDACQPLHGSIYSNGDPDTAKATQHTVTHKDGTTSVETVLRGDGVHSVYEEAMIDAKSKDLLAKLGALTANPPMPAIGDGHDAALAIVRLMDRAATRIPPKALVDTYADAGGGKSAKVIDLLWTTYGQATAECMDDGAKVLAWLWQSAWTQGGGIPAAPAVTEDQLKACYQNSDFTPSLDLDHIGPVLK
jgi:hypothetical protein